MEQDAVSLSGQNEANNSQTCLIGRWRNDYGSILDVRAHAPTGEFSGIYTSDTGASGTYMITGWSPLVVTGGKNRPFALCLFWKPIDSEVRDPGWNWVSFMSGVWFSDAPGGLLRIEVLHGLVASTPIETDARRRHGVHTATLSFEKVSSGGSEGARSDWSDSEPYLSSQIECRLALVNTARQARVSTLELIVAANGRAQGRLGLGDDLVPVTGFMDVDPVGPLQGLALSALVGGTELSTLALGGFIRTAEGKAELELFDAAPVSFANRYTAVTVSSETFAIRDHRTAIADGGTS